MLRVAYCKEGRIDETFSRFSQKSFFNLRVCTVRIGLINVTFQYHVESTQVWYHEKNNSHTTDKLNAITS